MIKLIQQWLDRYYEKIDCCIVSQENDKYLSLVLVNRKTNKYFMFDINFDDKHINYEVDMYYVDKDLARRIMEKYKYENLRSAISLLIEGMDHLDKESIKKLLVKWVNE